jgi:ectoine hydroxylase-related dioxygenase (phytanoyl-CoA dioxygenase family)
MDWRKEIEETGLAVQPGAFSCDHLDRLLADISRLSPRRSRAGIRHCLGLAPVAALAREFRLLELAQQVLGADAFPFRATLFDKSPVSNWLVVWHQDTALPLRGRVERAGWGPWSVKDGIDYAHAPAAVLEKVLALRISLDDSTLENGPLRVLPSTHKLGVLTDDDLHKLAARIAPFDCVAPKGSVVAMRPLVAHASSKSQTELSRRVMHIEYAASMSIAHPLELAVA